MRRRAFIKSLGASSASVALAACSDTSDRERYTAGDKALLTAQRAYERSNSGKGPFGIHRYRGYRGLAQLPWFEIGDDGRLRCVDDSIPQAIDVHCHMGMSVLFKPQLDLAARSERVRHLLDCDAQDPGCELDLDNYVNGNFTAEALEKLEDELMAQGLWGSRFAESQTIPSLLDEMDSMRVEQAVILPIKLGLWFGDDLTETWRSAIKNLGVGRRLQCGFSVHPRDSGRIEQLRLHVQRGSKVMKLHPTVQRFYPDDPNMMGVYEEAEKLGVVIFFHGGRAGIEPESSHRYAMPRHYEAVFANFPKLQCIIGHAGARDVRAMLDLALRYSNIWLDIHGQSITWLDEIIRRTGGERVMFGSDWPFYHIASSLAKVLIVTENNGRDELRYAVLRGNAESLLKRL